MKNWIIKHDRQVQRLLEILPGFTSWNIILFPYWGIFVMPNAVAYFVLLFNIYWFYQSFQIAVSATIAKDLETRRKRKLFSRQKVL